MSSKGRDLLKLTLIVAVAFALGLGFASAFNLPRPGMAESHRPAALMGAPAFAGPGTARRADGVMSFADIVEHVNPSVVYITTSGRSRTPANHPGDIPPEFQDFFRRYQQQQPRLRQGSGTGFITSRDGYILTNNHVVADADQVTVHLLDNREFRARVVGRDVNTDVAVIKIDATGLPAVAFGNSDQAHVGDWVLAFGNPLGFTFTVTAGIVSAKGRVLPGLQDENARLAIQDFIQTDAAINPGNSGGPLVNMNGEVVGINSAIASQTGLYSGYGFAIPINLARHVAEDLITKGRVDRAVLGINITDVTEVDASAVGLTEVKGVMVRQWPADGASPARSAGIQLGDVIVAVNDTAVDHVAQLQQMVGFKRPGETVRVTVVRREGGRTGVRRTLEVRLAAADAIVQTAARDTTGPGQPSEQEGRLGLRVENLPAQYVQRGQLGDEQRGVIVTDVEEGGPSFQKIAPPDGGGPDVITQVNDVRVRTPEDFKRALRGVAPGSVVQLRVVNLNQDKFPARIVNIRSR
jgi:serine protease Do